MKNICVLFFLMISGSGGTFANPDAIVGIWFTQIQDTQVEIYKKEDKFHGRVVWMVEPKDEEGRPKVDEKNPNATLRSRPIFQIDILCGFAYLDEEWTGGTIYDPNDGETYSCDLWLENGNLKVRSFRGWKFDTTTWTKANA